MDTETPALKLPPSMKVEALWLTVSKLVAALMNIGLPMLLALR